eukprot:COSAG02_NODE_20837_length_813_cov_3.425770_1_plen_27_part_10
MHRWPQVGQTLFFAMPPLPPLLLLLLL